MQMQAGMRIKEIIGANIKRRRAELGLTRRELGARIKVDQTMIYKWERGLHRPDDSHLAELAREFDRDLAWFYTEATD